VGSGVCVCVCVCLRVHCVLEAHSPLCTHTLPRTHRPSSLNLSLIASSCPWGWLYRQVAGFDMAAAMTQVARTPRLDTLSRSSQLFTSVCSLLKLDLGASGKPSPSSSSSGAEADGAEVLTARAAGEEGFSAPFTLEALRSERLFALMLWFDASFTFGGQSSVSGGAPGALWVSW
jgi:hypothetical protein